MANAATAVEILVNSSEFAALNVGMQAEAIKLLQSGAPKSERADIQELRQIRLARLYLFDGKPAEARKQLALVSKPLFPGIADELRGDIAVAEGDNELARKSYQQALTNLDQAAPTRTLLAAAIAVALTACASTETRVPPVDRSSPMAAAASSATWAACAAPCGGTRRERGCFLR